MKAIVTIMDKAAIIGTPHFIIAIVRALPKKYTADAEL
jgi:hypothetical protein